MNQAGASDMVDNELPDFSGKVVVFYMASPPAGTTNGVIMEEAQFRRSEKGCL